MNSWIYFAAASHADLRSTIDLAHLNKVISRTAKNREGNFIARVKSISAGDELYLACRGSDRHVALKATVAAPRACYEGTQALDVLDPGSDSATVEVLDFLYPSNVERTVFRLESVEPCFVDLSSREFPMHTIQPCPDFLSGNSVPEGEDGGPDAEDSGQQAADRFSDDENAISVLSGIFPYIGEFILETCLNSCTEKLSAVFGCESVCAVHRQCKLGFPESGVWFDGSGTLDLALELKNGDVIPVEVKLGYNGLFKSAIEQILQPCGLSSHTNETRISGKVPAALNQDFDNEVLELVGEEKLHAFIRNRWRPVSSDWRMIIRKCIEKSWDRRKPAGFSSGFKHVTLEELCLVIGEEDFNATVQSFFQNRNYFRLWIQE